MTKKIVIHSFILVFFLSAIPNFAAPGDGSTDKTLERMSSLCRLWGVVKYFHPYLAYKQIDWDQALIDTFPKVFAARSGEEYRQAVEFLLAFLDDPNTRVFGQDSGKLREKPEEKTKSEPKLKFTDDNIALITIDDITLFSDPSAAEKLRKIIKNTDDAEAIVFDIRQSDKVSPDSDGSASYYFSRAFNAVIPQLLADDVELPSYRYRMHSGYAPQAGGTSGGYYSSFVYVEGSVLESRGEGNKTKPLIFLLNSGSAGLGQVLTGMQLKGLAVIIQEGDTPGESGVRSHVVELADDLRVMVRNTEVVNPDGTIGFIPDLTLPDASGRENSIPAALEIIRGQKKIAPLRREHLPPVSQTRKEKLYANMIYPEEPYRLLALFRYWNVIEYFFPYKHLLDRPWDEVLQEFIPRMSAAGNALEYNLAIAELGVNIKDTHGFVSSKILSEYFGRHYPPLEVRSVQGATVIWDIFDDAAADQGLEIGDVILSIDEEEIVERRKRLSSLVAASTPQALRWRVNGIILGGSKDSKIKLSIKKKNGEIAKIVLDRLEQRQRSIRKTPIYSVLPSGFGYIDLSRLTIPQVDEAFEAVKKTTALIFDMRGYPRGTAWYIAPRIAEKKTRVAGFQRPEPHALMPDQPSIKSFYQYTSPASKWRYTGKVVVLIDENAISQAEHTCMFLESVTDVTFIGSPTNGANGDVTNTVLPGGIRMIFTGHDVRHADGSQLQRLGIQPHIKVEPSLAGVREGRDEILERAVEFLTSRSKK